LAMVAERVVLPSPLMAKGGGGSTATASPQAATTMSVRMMPRMAVLRPEA
jgi:hypothetical protein